MDTKKKHLVFTVTNDLNYDQRMIRICSSLAAAGYEVTLIGFKRKKSKDLAARPFQQKRIPIWFEQGKLLYVDYWIKLFFYLFIKKADLYCAIDLDTILPVLFVSKLKRKKRVYDAHELFTELKEVISRPLVHSMWKTIERYAVPQFQWGYTIGNAYAQVFKERYGSNYAVVRNATVLQETKPKASQQEPYILYQGWVNVGRCFEELIPAMKEVPMPLIVCGEGNFYTQAQALVKANGLEDKIIFKGYVAPEALKNYTQNAFIGLTLFEATSMSNRLSMANRFFDYMHAGVPQLCNAYPEYISVNQQYEIAYLVEQVSPQSIAKALNTLITDKLYYDRLTQNCYEARKKYCWQEEEKTLLKFYSTIFES